MSSRPVPKQGGTAGAWDGPQEPRMVPKSPGQLPSKEASWMVPRPWGGPRKPRMVPETPGWS